MNEKLLSLSRKSPWILRIVDSRSSHPTLQILERRQILNADKTGVVWHLVGRGELAGDSSTRHVLWKQAALIISRVWDEQQVPLELHRFLNPDQSAFRGDLPLDDEAGYKIAIIFKLQYGIRESDRAELLARRVERMTREEAGYWLSRLWDYGADESRFAIAGMRQMLAGRAGDEGVQRILASLRRFS